MTISNNLKDLNIILPKAPKPVGSYVASKISGSFVYISGQLPIKNNGEIIKGKIGKELTLEQGQEAAYYCCLNIISQLSNVLNNKLDNVKSCVKITGYVNSVDDFIDQPQIINSASELLTKIFGEAGKHTRAAVSVNSLPLGVAVEIDAIFEIK